MAKHDHPGGGPVNKGYPGDNARPGKHNRAVGGEDQSAGLDVPVSNEGVSKETHDQWLETQKGHRGK